MNSEPMYVLYPSPSDPPPITVRFLPGGEIELPDGMTLEEAIAELWAQHAKHPELVDASFFAGLALLEVRALAGRVRFVEGEPAE